jgi:anthranilate synthase component II
MILVLDNFDSFTYNLVQLLGAQTGPLVVRRNNAVSLDEIAGLRPKGILISPGPGRPEDAGISMEVIRRYGAAIPVLGVCLGHQAIGQVYGARIVHAPAPMHGKLSPVHHNGTGLFVGVPNPFRATRYHSLVIDPSAIPPDLEITAHSPDGIIMGIRHRLHPVQGVQFHPESVMTEHGASIIRNWLGMQK